MFKKILLALLMSVVTCSAMAQVQSGGRQSSGSPVRLDDGRWIKLTGTASAMATSLGVVSLFRAGVVIITGLATETIKVEGIVAVAQGITPVNFSIQVQKLDGTIQNADALGNGVYYFDVLFEDVKVTKSASTDNPAVTFYFRT